jgi:hypothetical protein
MKCSSCGTVLPAMKTIYFTEEGDEAEEHACCDSRYEQIEDEGLIVPGPYSV